MGYEEEKAFKDLVLFGTSILIKYQDGTKKHVPLEDFYNLEEYEECRKSLEAHSVK